MKPINYRTKNTYGKFNITPTGKIIYGVTELSEFTDFISKAADRPATNIRFNEDIFEDTEYEGFTYIAWNVSYRYNLN